MLLLKSNSRNDGSASGLSVPTWRYVTIAVHIRRRASVPILVEIVSCKQIIWLNSGNTTVWQAASRLLPKPILVRVTPSVNLGYHVAEWPPTWLNGYASAAMRCSCSYCQRTYYTASSQPHVADRPICRDQLGKFGTRIR